MEGQETLPSTSALPISETATINAKAKKPGIKKFRRQTNQTTTMSSQLPNMDLDSAEPATSSVGFSSPKLSSQKEPGLQQVLDGISVLDEKINRIEQQISKVSNMQSNVAAQSTQGLLPPGGRRSRRSRLSTSGAQKNQVSPAWQANGESKLNGVYTSTNGQIFIKVSVQMPNTSEWQCPKEATEAETPARITSAARITAMGKSPSAKAFQGKILVHIRSAKGLPRRDIIGNSDPYCMCAVSHEGVVQDRFTTRVLPDTCDPGWNEERVFEGVTIGSTLHFNVKDKDAGITKVDEDEPLGHCSLSWSQFYPKGFHGAVNLAEGESAVTDLVDPSKNLSPGISKLVGQLKKFEKKGDRSTQASLARAVTVSGIADMPTEQKDITLDVFMGLLILIQTVFIGFSMDYEYNYFIAFDILFLVCYIIEAYLKMRLHGLGMKSGYFTRLWECFNFTLILLDITQMILSGVVNKDGDNQFSTILRMIRFVRLARLFRIVNLEVQFLTDLVAMLGGILGGTPTLISAVALFLAVVYITSLLFRELFGREAKIMYCEECGDVDITEMFENVPRAMLTVFRFFFGDFSTIQGVNLYEGIQIGYGTTAQLFVCMVFFIVFIGVFNVITAIFVESTLAAAAKLERSKLLSRLQNEELWVEKINVLIWEWFEQMGKNEPGVSLSKLAEEWHQEPLYVEQFQNYIKDPEVREALDDLDIDNADHPYLFDILDADNAGSIYLDEFIDGLARLRGFPRRSDTITIDLMVREVQTRTQQMGEAINSLLERVPEQSS